MLLDYTVQAGYMFDIMLSKEHHIHIVVDDIHMLFAASSVMLVPPPPDATPSPGFELRRYERYIMPQTLPLGYMTYIIAILYLRQLHKMIARRESHIL